LPLFTQVRGRGILGSSLPASNTQVTAKITHLGDTPALLTCHTCPRFATW
jgi:hypothetical protein